MCTSNIYPKFRPLESASAKPHLLARCAPCNDLPNSIARCNNSHDLLDVITMEANDDSAAARAANFRVVRSVTFSSCTTTCTAKPGTCCDQRIIFFKPAGNGYIQSLMDFKVPSLTSLSMHPLFRITPCGFRRARSSRTATACSWQLMLLSAAASCRSGKPVFVSVLSTTIASATRGIQEKQRTSNKNLHLRVLPGQGEAGSTGS